MAKKRVIKIAVDPGFSSLKVVCEGHIFELPQEVIENTGNEDLFVADKKETYAAAEYLGKTYIVGEYARKLLLEDNRQNVMDVNASVLNDFERFSTVYFEVSIMTAIGIALVKYCEFTQSSDGQDPITVEDLKDCDICLAIAIPHAVYAQGKAGPAGIMRQRVYGQKQFTLELSDATYNLDFTLRPDIGYKFQSQVIAALLGTLYDEYDMTMDLLDTDDKAKPILVIDGGYKTVGIFKLSQVDSVEEAESNANFAMALVDEKVAALLAQKGRSDIKPYNIQELYNTKEEIAIMDRDTGEAVMSTINEERNEIIKEYCAIMIDYLREKYNNLLPIKQILITGGTGAAYYETFVNYINTTPEMAHLRGKVKLAEYQFMGKEVSPVHAIVVGLYKQFKKYLDQNL